MRADKKVLGGSFVRLRPEEDELDGFLGFIDGGVLAESGFLREDFLEFFLGF